MKILKANQPANVAYIDDDKLHLQALSEKFKKKGLVVETFSQVNEGLEFIRNRPNQFKIIIVDFIMGELRGDSVVREIKEINPKIHTAVLSSELNRQVIKICQLSGADHIYDKRSNSDVLLRLAEIAKSKLKMQPRSQEQMEENGKVIKSTLRLYGRSSALAHVSAQVKTYADCPESVLILGKSGVGKEKIAEAIHDNSNRKDGPFIVVNCAAISKDLIQSELFGHKKGSFSGAIYDKKGCFEEANGGTIFLDEIGDMPLEHQVNLLRVLQERKITRVGESRPMRINVKVIAATNQDIGNLSIQGKFREDLLYRLNELSILIPPLSERKEDIEPIAKFIISEKNKATFQNKEISSDAIEYLESRLWPGNIRELEAAIKRAYVESDQVICSENFKMHSVEKNNNPLEFEYLINSIAVPKWHELKQEFDRYEKKYLEKVLSLAHGNRSKAAKLAGIPYTSYLSKRQRFNLDFC